MNETDMEQWREIADAMQTLQDAQTDLLDELARGGDVPKGTYRDHYEQLSDAQSKLKSDLEDRLFEEHPDDATIGIFYGDD